ncbi:MAG: DUF6263 family protein [FCB group bacterium]|nr:DUF6263 family protein [FCB group bacterium]
MRGTIVLFTCLAALVAGAQETVPIQLQVKAGDVLPLRVVTNQEISQTVLGQQRRIKQEVEYRYAIAVDSIDADGAINATVTWEEAAIHRDMKGEVVGDEPMTPAVNADAAARARLLEALKGQRFRLRTTSAGEVLEVSGTGDAVAQLTKVLEPSSEEERALTEQSVREQYGDQAMREIMQRVLAVYPPKPVAVGESWVRTLTATKGFPFVIKSTYTLKEAAPDRVAIEEKAEVTTDTKPIANPPGTGTTSYSLTGGQAGTITLWRDTGWYAEATLNQQAYGHVAYDAGGSDKKKTAVPLSVKTEVRIAGREETQ